MMALGPNWVLLKCVGGAIGSLVVSLRIIPLRPLNAYMQYMQNRSYFDNVGSTFGASFGYLIYPGQSALSHFVNACLERDLT